MSDTIRAERVTHSLVRDVDLPGGAGTLALVTLDNGFDHTKPNTLGPIGMAELTERLTELRARATAGEIAAIAITGKPYILAAGADLLGVGTVRTHDEALQLGRMGHAAYELLHEAGVPTFAFVNGLALGGGLEVALNADYRTVASDVAALALPETGLGLVPGWGGAYLVPRLIGIEKAVDVILRRPAQNKPFKPAEALALGLVDVQLDAADFLEQSIAWAARVVRGEVAVTRRELDPQPVWDAVVAGARGFLDAVVHGSRPAPYRALDLLAAARTATRAEAFAAEDEALADLIMSDEMRASVYAFGLVSGGKRPEGAPDPKLARPVTRVGIVGAGLMAAQIALLVTQRLGVPVVMRDLDQERVDKGLGYVRSTVEKLASRGRLAPDAAARIVASVHGTTDLQEFASCDVVVEAVTEILSLKKRVFAELETVVPPETILATNTSALSVTEMAADLQHPDRVVGLHFFNPVAQMPLVEVVQAEQTSPEALATAFAITKKLRKTAVLVKDRPGFVVNRLLVLVMGKVVEAIENGTAVAVADRALDPLGFPMPTFELFDLVGPAVGLHVLTSLREDLGDRFPASPGLEKLVAEGTRVVLDAPAPGLHKPVDPAIQAAFGEALPAGSEGRHGTPVLDGAGVLDAVLTALTVEVGHMLDEGVVAGPPQIDLCMILGAGWGFHTGGITPYLDRTGYSERVLGRRLLPDGVANVPAAVGG
ncbi:3-hydroxyacyl-CoA dehydrogenase NAD-binding protein [Xylanimonas cellulosilytica DSM 15894]|uniref:3-hydroxyacyl-CoA dehydrogenase NAD-binding protein n=1 Tax=Xylanimonas cellulosilytica (strain DSM 15894 / JCM 12276 / CECT 5975 / KCTC 9989 / LMG 20990 / NBRC 107835 / XIL07) TaxID=446471 RepID=D1BT70_XYLCX|nr:3-hydroxyacyl-CoA dehydrogenase NAD-binding domain-containing protein [Xylanimonas cellulosilytica]ACZ30912.1 3-hydroxyacyl-CoA dehydrogenase NAD-binding protein [Xylanimonas cellulosilytica DSM 15894]